ncbi:putative ribosomal small subunit assembly [Trypoxylus dichotomus]
MDDINLLIKEEEVAVSETTIMYPTPDIKPDIKIKEEPIDTYNTFDGNLLDSSVKIEETQISQVKQEELTSPKEFKTASIIKPFIKKTMLCRDCGEEYFDFCPKCPMMIRVFDNRVKKHTADRAKETLPTKMLKFNDSINDNNHVEVFAIRLIPTGVTFGPFQGIKRTKLEDGRICFEAKNGKVACMESHTDSNWMRFVRCSPTFKFSNLIMIQCGEQLYYRTRVPIQKDEQLIVQFSSYNRNYFEPIVIEGLANTYDCARCCLGFSSIMYLRLHRIKCSSWSMTKKIPIESHEVYNAQPTPPPTPLNTKPVANHLKVLIRMASCDDINLNLLQEKKVRFKGIDIQIKEEVVDMDDSSGNLQDYTIKFEEAQIAQVKKEEEPSPQNLDTVFTKELANENLTRVGTEHDRNYKDFWPTCPMEIHILDNPIEKRTANRAKKTLPKMLELLEPTTFTKGGVFTTIPIPSGVTFGPFEGVKSARLRNVKCGFEVEDGKIACDESYADSNWMQFVQYRDSFSSSNLVMIQYCEKLYYRTRVPIKRNEQLLVQFNSSKVKHKYFEPVLVKNLTRPYTCTPCCLGFGSKMYLRSHWTICPHPRTAEDIRQNIYDDSPAPLYIRSTANSLKPIVYKPHDAEEPSNSSATRRTCNANRAKVWKVRCVIYPRLFYGRQQLDKHQAVHDEERKPARKTPLYKCNYCDHVSERRCVNLVQHMLHKG